VADSLDEAKAACRVAWDEAAIGGRSGRDMRRRQPKLARSAGARPALGNVASPRDNAAIHRIAATAIDN
jgi:hypothetical protein